MTQQRPSDALQCFPDRYLTQEHLEVLFNDFNINIPETSRTNASVFSHLVNGVRQVYMSEISRLHQEIVGQCERRLCDLLDHKKQLEQERSTLPKIDHTINQGRRAVEALPADTATIYIGAALNPRRDMVDWDHLDRLGWKNRLEFNVFRFSEIGTVNVLVCDNDDDRVRRVNVFLKTTAIPAGWKERIQFHVFESQRPNTEMISVGQSYDPERSIFVRGQHADKLDGWEEKFVFWVPL